MAYHPSTRDSKLINDGFALLTARCSTLRCDAVAVARCITINRGARLETKVRQTVLIESVLPPARKKIGPDRRPSVSESMHIGLKWREPTLTC